MSEKYKLGLTRNRLFALDNAVVFEGVCDSSFDERECVKAMKMLSAKEPIITGIIELDEDSSAYVVTGKTEPVISFVEEEASVIKNRYDQKGLDFSKSLFEFTFCKGNALIAAAHTAVCDSKSLLRLVKEFVDFYCHKSISIEPSEIVTFPDFKSLPAKLNSPIIDKLSADLEGKWKNKKAEFQTDDWVNAVEKYSSKKSEIGMIKETVSADDKNTLLGYCVENNIDLTSLLAYGLYDSVYNFVSVPKKARKLSVCSDRRFFLSDMEKCAVGAFNGNVDVSLKPKDLKKGAKEKLKVFHTALYKGVTSAFRTFYDELLLMKLPPVYCDASYMNRAGCFSSSAAARLANNYGCNDARIMNIFSCNLSQEYWSQLSFFEKVSVQEPYVRKYYTMADVVIGKDDININFRYNKDKITDETASLIVEKAIKTMLDIAE